MYELMLPELVYWIFDNLDEGDEKPPGVRAVHNKPLEQHPGDLLLNGLGVGLREQIEQCAREIVRVTVWVTQLVCYCVQEQVPEMENIMSSLFSTSTSTYTFKKVP